MQGGDSSRSNRKMKGKKRYDSLGGKRKKGSGNIFCKPGRRAVTKRERNIIASCKIEDEKIKGRVASKSERGAVVLNGDSCFHGGVM